MRDSRRQFLKDVGIMSGMLMTEARSAISSSGFLNATTEIQPQFEEGFIKIRNPRDLGADRLTVERIPVGERGFCKPNHVRLSGDELLLVCFEELSANGMDSPANPQVYQFRSRDGGRTWIGPEWLHIDDTAWSGGGEPYLFRANDGTLLMSCGTWGYRSEDGGRTWIKRLEPEDFATKASSNITRNFLQLKDGSLLQIVDFSEAHGVLPVMGHEFVARSRDGGRSWPETYPCKIEGVPHGYGTPIVSMRGASVGYSLSAFFEGYLWQSRSSEKLYCIARVDTRYYPLPGRFLNALELASANVSAASYCLPPIARIPQSLDELYFDQVDRLKVFTSTDMGHTWQPSRDLGDYGYMYPSILELHGGRLLLTYTVRSIDPPLGVRAVLGREGKDGLEFNFDHDVIMIDSRTPIGRRSGGGFGPTIQLDDGTLVTSYSYWPPDDKRKPCEYSPPYITQCEVARWRLPATN